MTHDHWGIVSGVIALALGVLATLQLVPAEEPAPQPVAATSSPSLPAPAPATPDVPGVPASIDRVLQQTGDARLAENEELAQLPPAVASVLVDFGVPLRVPTPEGSGS